MAGYDARQSTYTTGDIVEALDSNAEFDAILAAQDATTGHAHGGAAGEGAPIVVTTTTGGTQYGVPLLNGAGIAVTSTAAFTGGQVLIGQAAAVPGPKTISGDATLGASGAFTLASTAVTPASYGSATASPTYTVDAKGRLTAAADVPITPAFSSITSTPTTLAGYGITDAQGLDATLTSLAALGTAADKLAYTTGVDTWAEAAVTAAGRAILDDANAAAQRTTLGLGTAAVVNTGTTTGLVPLIGTKSSTITLAGLVERSTSAENVTGTDDTVSPTVAGVKEMIDTHVPASVASAISTSVQMSSNGSALANDDGTTNANVGIGLNAAANLTSGFGTVAIGDGAIATGVTTGAHNVAIGSGAGSDLTSAEYSVLLGQGAGANITTAANSIAIGQLAMGLGIGTGLTNVAIGKQAGYDITSAADSVLIGTSAGSNITTAANSIAIGKNAMKTGVTTGADNTAIGQNAGNALTSGTYNNLIGFEAGKVITGGHRNVVLGYNNLIAGGATASDCIIVGSNCATSASFAAGSCIVIGNAAGQDMTSASTPIAIGYHAAYNTTTAARPIAIGRDALGSGITTGDDNIGIGYKAGNDITSATDCVFIGTGAGDAIGFATGANTMALGNLANPSSNSVSNEITLGNSSVATSRIQVDWTILSDERDKANIKPLQSSLDFINALNPVSFQWDIRDHYYTEETVVDADGNEDVVRTPAPKDGSKLNPNTTMGFLSQEVLEAIGTHGEAALGDLVLATNPEKLELQRGGILVPLVKAVQELSVENENLRTRLEVLEGLLAV